jgi:hypothetical protein
MTTCRMWPSGGGTGGSGRSGGGMLRPSQLPASGRQRRGRSTAGGSGRTKRGPLAQRGRTVAVRRQLARCGVSPSCCLRMMMKSSRRRPYAVPKSSAAAGVALAIWVAQVRRTRLGPRRQRHSPTAALVQKLLERQQTQTRQLAQRASGGGCRGLRQMTTCLGPHHDRSAKVSCDL